MNKTIKRRISNGFYLLAKVTFIIFLLTIDYAGMLWVKYALDFNYLLYGRLSLVILFTAFIYAILGEMLEVKDDDEG